jgi:hypothetical protein
LEWELPLLLQLDRNKPAAAITAIAQKISHLDIAEPPENRTGE